MGVMNEVCLECSLDTYVAHVELISGIGARGKVVVVRWTRRRCGMQTLTGHCHADLTWNGCSTESRLVFAILHTAEMSYHVITTRRTSRMNTGRPSRACSESSRMALCESS